MTEEKTHTSQQSNTESSAKAKTYEKGFDYVRSAMSDYPLGTRIALNIVLFLIWVFFKIFYPYKIERKDYLIEQVKQQGVMIVQNHVSMVEPVAMVLTLWRAGIHVRPVYKAEFEKISAAKWLFRRAGGLPVDRGKADMRAVRAAKEALERGECVLIYPEGTRIKSNDQPIEMHGGFAMMAAMAKAPVLPTAVVGAADPYKTRKTIRRKPIFGVADILRLEDMPGESRKDKQQALEDTAIAQMYATRDRLRNENPGLW